jgi:hypothetical protein
MGWQRRTLVMLKGRYEQMKQIMIGGVVVVFLGGC